VTALCSAAAVGARVCGVVQKTRFVESQQRQTAAAATRSRITGRRSRGGSLGLSELLLDLRIQCMPGNPHSHVSHHPTCTLHAPHTRAPLDVHGGKAFFHNT